MGTYRFGQLNEAVLRGQVAEVEALAAAATATLDALAAAAARRYADYRGTASHREQGQNRVELEVSNENRSYPTIFRARCILSFVMMT